PLPLRRGPTTTVTQFLPALTLTDLGTEARAGGTRANWLRTLWMNMGTMPEYQREVPSIGAMFQPFEKPIDLAVESAIAQRFQGIEELYPTADGIRKMEAERRDLETLLHANQGNLERAEESTAALNDLDLINRALDEQTRQLLRRRLHEID